MRKGAIYMSNATLLFEEMYLHFYQDILIPDKTKREVDFIMQKFNFVDGDLIADIPCGFGRHSLEMARRLPSVNITGIDISSFYLNMAEQSRKPLRLTNVSFLQGDIRNLEFKNKFNLITCLYTSFGYFDDDVNIKILQGFYNSLCSGGHLLLETINMGIIEEGEIIFANKGNDRIIDITKREKAGFFIINRNYIINQKSHEFNYTLRLYNIDQLSSILSEIGFEIISAYGDYDGVEYSASTPRMILIVRKK